MSSLRDQNVAKCMETLRDFNNSIQDGDVALMEKKDEAERALDHLNSLFATNADEGPGGDCEEKAASC